MAVNDLYALTVKSQVVGTTRTAENTFYFRQTLALVFDTPEEDLQKSFEDNALVPYQNCFSAQWQLVTYTFALMPDNLVSKVVDITGETGALTGDSLPPSSAGILSYRSATPGRRGQGRLFLPSANEAQSGSDGQPIASYITTLGLLGDGLASMVDDIVTTAAWRWEMWSPSDQVGRTITSWTGRSYWGVQKGRRT